MKYGGLRTYGHTHLFSHSKRYIQRLPRSVIVRWNRNKKVLDIALKSRAFVVLRIRAVHKNSKQQRPYNQQSHDLLFNESTIRVAATYSTSLLSHEPVTPLPWISEIQDIITCMAKFNISKSKCHCNSKLYNYSFTGVITSNQ